MNMELIFKNIVKEIKYLENDLDTSYIINNSLYESSDEKQVITVILQYYQYKDLKLIDSVRISNWLKVKLPEDSIKIKFIK